MPLLYAIFTRKAEGLFLQDFNPQCIKANTDGLHEIERIRKYSMVSEKIDRLTFFEDYPSENWMYISLQNVRSISMHLNDVLLDPIMQASSILCLTETSQSDKNWLGWKKFSNFDVYTCMRNENSINGDDHRKSGGVALLVKNGLESKNVHSIDPQLEMTSANIKWVNESGFITCIYKDHAMPKNIFKNKMEKVFENFQIKPSIIAGDFNLYDENGRYNGLLNSLALENNYFPLVHKSTTINGHLLDQIFINDENYVNSSKIVTLPSYFSDHDLIVLCIKKQFE